LRFPAAHVTAVRAEGQEGRHDEGREQGGGECEARFAQQGDSADDDGEPQDGREALEDALYGTDAQVFGPVRAMVCQKTTSIFS